MDIIAAHQLTGSFRAAADLCGTTHKTVKRVVEQAAAERAGEVKPTRAKRPANYDVVAGWVAGKVATAMGRISAKRLLPAARAEGYQGSDRNFRRLVAKEKARWRRDQHRGRRPAVWAPGEYLVIDWGDVGGGLHVFCAVLPWSRWRFVRFADNERAATTLGLIAEALHAAGGVPLKVLADRMGCLKGGVVANVVVPTPAYVRFATHYRFAPDFCHAADPQSKGVVENLVGYAQRDLVDPLLAAAGTGRAVGVAAANAAAEQWCAEVNAAVHSEIAAVPDERLARERKVLQALPSLRLEVGPPPVTRKVDRLSCVRFASARYSVPTRLIGTTVRLVPLGAQLTILDAGTGEVVAEHAMAAPGEMSVLDDHYPTPRTPPSRGPRPRTAVERRFCGLGEVAEAFLVGSAAAGNTRLAADLEQLLALGAAHGEPALLAALQRAVAFRRWRAGDVRSILAAGAGVAQPRPAGDALVVDLPVAAARDLAEYAIAGPARQPRPDAESWR